jgi:copper resistance protein D
MADDWSNIALRFAVYADLMVLFGVPLFVTLSLGRPDRTGTIGLRFGRIAAAAAVVGAVLSLLALMVMAKQMAGVSDYSAVTRHVVEMILTRTSAGFAWAARVGALAACVVALLALRSRPELRFALLACGGGVALATLAWTGHGAMDDGARGYLHLSSDAVHLLAAGAWVGALFAFVTLSIAPGQGDRGTMDCLARTASGFARIGTLVVLALLVTGIVNYVLIAGPTLRGLVATLYGRLLLVKLALVAGMVGLAAANRYRFAPRLEAAVAAGDHALAARALRRSLGSECGLAALVLAVVAWLGVLSPDA